MPIVKADANERKLTVPSEAMVKFNSYNVSDNLYCVEVPIIIHETSRCYYIYLKYLVTY